MSEETKKDFIQKINFDSPKAAPAVLTVGAAIWKGIAELANVDFILSVREERLAMMFQFILDYGWLLLVVVGLIWILQAHRSPDRERIHWGMVASVGILAFMTGILVSVYATGSLPNIMQQWSGDPMGQTCNAQVDTSRLIGFKNGYRLVLICGASDPKVDPQEDDRIAVSAAFHITGQPVAVLAPFGNLAEFIKQSPAPPPGQQTGFVLWHAVALIPKESDPASIKRVSDVYRQGGRIVTDPAAGGFGNPMVAKSTPLVATQPSPK
jgi:hypothetical protein